MYTTLADILAKQYEFENGPIFDISDIDSGVVTFINETVNVNFSKTIHTYIVRYLYIDLIVLLIKVNNAIFLI